MCTVEGVESSLQGFRKSRFLLEYTKKSDQSDSMHSTILPTQYTYLGSRVASCNLPNMSLSYVYDRDDNFVFA